MSGKQTLMKNLAKKHAEKIRFIIVGFLNTAIDFIILFALANALGFPDLVSNIVSTSIALAFSFMANKTYTFKGSSASGKQFAYFLIITLFGLWVIQGIIIFGFKSVAGPLFDSADVTLFAGKLVATCASLTWNYLMYRKFVFIKK